MTPGETLGTLYNIHVGSNKTKQHRPTPVPRSRGPVITRDLGVRGVLHTPLSPPPSFYPAFLAPTSVATGRAQDLPVRTLVPNKVSLSLPPRPTHLPETQQE